MAGIVGDIKQFGTWRENVQGKTGAPAVPLKLALETWLFPLNPRAAAVVSW